VKEILYRDLGLKEYIRRSVPYELSEAQKKCGVDQSRSVHDMLQLYARHNFGGITTGDESWFLYSTYTNSMFAVSAAEVVPRTKQNISARKTMVTIFFTSTRLLVLNFLPKGTRFNQAYFIDAVPPNLYREKTRIARHKGRPGFGVHMDNSMCQNGAKVIEKLASRHIVRAPHPLYSPDLSPCDFWLFGFLKEKMKDQVFRSEEEMSEVIVESWNELTFEDIKRVFQNWMERRIWVIENSGDDYQS
jgi:hypothetical protein